MELKELLYEVADGVAVVTMNRPEKLNAWTFSMEKEYRWAIADAEQRDDVRVIVITGAGRGFCAGADMSLLSSVQSGDVDFDDMPDQSKAFGNGAAVPEDFCKPYTFPPAVSKPIIGAINGPAMGLGLVHACFCDIRFASDQAKFGSAFVHRGLIAEHGIAWVLPRLVGIENALDLLLSGRIIDGTEAHQLGLVSRVVPHDQLMDTVMDYAKMLATKCSPRAMSIIKRQVWDGLLTELGPATDVAIQEMLASFGTEDFREGVLSFLEKRPPAFTGK